MSLPYQELFAGQVAARKAPGPRHEQICTRLHEAVRASVANIHSARLLAPRTQVEVRPGTLLCPDLAIVTTAGSRLWLAAEIVSSDDHRLDTVVKKQIYEEIRVPRLWMLDPRYDNVEVYHSTQYGLMLKGMLAGQDLLTEQLLPEFQYVISALFDAGIAGN